MPNTPPTIIHYTPGLSVPNEAEWVTIWLFGCKPAEEPMPEDVLRSWTIKLN